MIPTFTRSYEAAAAVTGYLIVKFADPGNDQTVEVADGNTEPLVGVADSMGAELGGMLDVHRGGLVSVRLGGAVNAGDPLTSDASGKAIAAAAAASTTVRIIGYADQAGVADDIIDVMWAPGLLHEA